MNKHGEFIWYELMTSDLDAAADFYGAVIGLGCRECDNAGGAYRIFGIGGADVAGLMTIPEEARCQGARPGWLGYVGVNDVDKAAADVIEAGGTQHVPPTDIPGIGRFAMLADPQGATFYVMRGAMEGISISFAPSRIGHCHWNELSTSDPAAALAFYRGRFGWEKGDAMPMGEMGEYQFIEQDGRAFGAIMRRREDGPPPRWTFYFGVEDIDVAATAVKEKGGVIHYGPAEVPGNIHIIIASDPQGALFGLVGPRKA